MNILWNVGEMAISWTFPQVGATLRAARWANTAYKATKCAASIFTGDVIGSVSAVAQAVSTCEEIRDTCIEEIMKEPVYTPDDAKTKGWKLAACHASYWICKFFK